MEIVTQPEINSPEEAFAFLSALKQILIYGAVAMLIWRRDNSAAIAMFPYALNIKPNSEQKSNSRI
jgi:Asp-tRNAAsn/Glu-tRNAGln amidotransferase B subunit (PET112 homolog)